MNEIRVSFVEIEILVRNFILIIWKFLISNFLLSGRLFYGFMLVVFWKVYWKDFCGFSDNVWLVRVNMVLSGFICNNIFGFYNIFVK